MNKAFESGLAIAGRLAARGKMHEMLYVLEELFVKNSNEKDLANRIGNQLLGIGHLSKAAEYFEQTLKLDAANIIAQTGLAQVAHDAGRHDEARQRYEALLKQYPDNPVIQRNALLSAEYDPNLTDKERFKNALAWGTWIQGQTPIRNITSHLINPNRPLNVGYVSADLCQHTVGLLAKDIITNHNPARVRAFVYSATAKSDWVTQDIRTKTQFRDIHHLDDDALETLIRADHIDVLIDLSGHTAGSRLSVFARKPAPVQISWLGYFATTGLQTIDAVLLDEGHTTSETQKIFCEKIVKLPSRFYFAPLDFYPDVSPPPCIKNGYITFGSFNNTAKINSEVIKVWSTILNQVPDSRLILKWRTYIDPIFREWTLSQFAQTNIDQKRIELRSASFHKEVLKQYADIDIALDPFPFTGGLSSLETLWMGVPVITLNGSSVVNRQTAAILKNIGAENQVCESKTNYVNKAIQLARERDKLLDWRNSARAQIKQSNLMNLELQLIALEQCFCDLLAENIQKHKLIHNH